jgi:parallel beta-helix repeat protein
MKTQRCPLIVLLFSTINFQPSTCLAQGNLNPSGPPAPSFKTLDQIEPRTPISALPFTITNPGTYYLTTNLTGISGILVNTNDVTIDLNGFTLTGGTGDGIVAGTSRTNLAVFNGTVRNWVNGMNINARYSRAERVLAYNNGGAGLGLGTEEGMVIGCAAVSNHINGIVVGANSLVKDCVSIFNGSGIVVVGAGTTVLSSIASSNMSTGITGLGINGIVIKDCTATGNGDRGIEASKRIVVSGCTACGNLNDGIAVAGDSLVLGDLAVGNTNNSSAGIHVFSGSTGTRVEGNSVNGNARGIFVEGTFNLIIKNTAHGNGTNYVFGSSNIFGPTNTVSGELTTNSPFSNFSY